MSPFAALPSSPRVPRFLLVAAMAATLACNDSPPPQPVAAPEPTPPPAARLVLPDIDRTRTERIERLHGRFATPEGFTVEQAAPPSLTGSIVNMTFDHLGRPALSKEGGPIILLEDEDGDGIYDTAIAFSDRVHTAHGMHYLAPGDLLVHADGPRGAGLYRLTDTDGDDRADIELLIARSDGPIGEHGPHAILTGADGFLYVIYGNHARPGPPLDPASPSRGLREDQLLPRYLDPRGHANNIRAPGGAIFRLDPGLRDWSQFAAGMRNAFDMAIDLSGEIFTFDSDMEWDFGLPWYRPIRVLHAVPGADFGWRTGSGKFPADAIDTLPPIDTVGRGSPVGVAFYHHRVYPDSFFGALFLGDWSRGRIRVIFPRPDGATYAGETADFILGEPLNVTDLDVGPDGFLYFTTGGRQTSGGLYRVRYDGPAPPARDATGIDALLDLPMPRSAWSKLALTEAKAEMGDRWAPDLRAAALDPARDAPARVRAIETLQVHGPAPDLDLLAELAADPEPRVRAAAVSLMGLFPLADVRPALLALLDDADPVVLRRACESLVRAGLGEAPDLDDPEPLAARLFALLDHPDRFVRHAARQALLRVDRSLWRDRVLTDRLELRPHGALEGLLALIHSGLDADDSDTAAALFAKLDRMRSANIDDETLVRYLRILGLARIRAPGAGDPPPERAAALDRIGLALLDRFPTGDPAADRDLQVALASLQTPGAADALLDFLTPDRAPDDQIHTAYALRAIETGWTPAQRRQLLDWFDRAWEFRGAASMEGYINHLWEDALQIATAAEREAAEARRAESIAARARAAAARLARFTVSPPRLRTELAQMSFEELSNYLEYDPMTYERGDPDRGGLVFERAGCVDCHVFGAVGRGGGPDLSSLVSRLRRREILESIMYPSRVISDQYTALRVDVRDAPPVDGMLVAESDALLTLISATGQRLEIPKDEITARQPSDLSIMPEGLLDLMGLQDLVNLILYLERGPN